MNTFKKFHNSWITPAAIEAVTIRFKKEFSASGLAVEIQSETPELVAVVLSSGVVLNLEKEDAQEFYLWWKESNHE